MNANLHTICTQWSAVFNGVLCPFYWLLSQLKASAEAAAENISSSCIWSFLQKLIQTRLIFICFGLLFISSCGNFVQCSKVFACFDGVQTVSIEILMSLKAIGQFAPSNGVQKLQIAFSCDGNVRAQKIKHTKTSLVLEYPSKLQTHTLQPLICLRTQYSSTAGVVELCTND